MKTSFTDLDPCISFSGKFSLLNEVLITAYACRKIDLVGFLVKFRCKLRYDFNYIAIVSRSQNSIYFRKLF